MKLVEHLPWISTRERLPDSDTTVLVALHGTSEPVWIGYWDEPHWIDASTAMPFSGEVTHWAEMPSGPAEVA